MRKNKGSIRKLSNEKEIALLEQFLPYPQNPNKFQKYWNLQNEGKGTFLIFWESGIPVGYVFLKVDPASCTKTGCPEIEDLFVNEDYRGKRRGPKLVRFAEQMVRGYKKNELGLAVYQSENARLEPFYTKLGYKKSEEPITLDYDELDITGNMVRKSKDAYYYIRNLYKHDLHK